MLLPIPPWSNITPDKNAKSNITLKIPLESYENGTFWCNLSWNPKKGLKLSPFLFCSALYGKYICFLCWPCVLFSYECMLNVFSICKHNFSCDIPINSQKIVISLIRGSDPLRWRVLSVVPMYCCGRLVSKSTTVQKVLGTNIFKNPEGSSHHIPPPTPCAR